MMIKRRRRNVEQRRVNCPRSCMTISAGPHPRPPGPSQAQTTAARAPMTTLLDTGLSASLVKHSTQINILRSSYNMTYPGACSPSRNLESGEGAGRH